MRRKPESNSIHYGDLLRLFRVEKIFQSVIFAIQFYSPWDDQFLVILLQLVLLVKTFNQFKYKVPKKILIRFNQNLFTGLRFGDSQVLLGGGRLRLGNFTRLWMSQSER